MSFELFVIAVKANMCKNGKASAAGSPVTVVNSSFGPMNEE